MVVKISKLEFQWGMDSSLVYHLRNLCNKKAIKFKQYHKTDKITHNVECLANTHTNKHTSFYFVELPISGFVYELRGQPSYMYKGMKIYI